MALFECKHCNIDATKGLHEAGCPSLLLAGLRQDIGNAREAAYSIDGNAALTYLLDLADIVRQLIGAHDGQVDDFQDDGE
jgi:hypothetical protein